MPITRRASDCRQRARTVKRAVAVRHHGRMPPTVDDLRRHALARSLFRPASLPQALARLGFVQADPLRAPARAQDLILRHRVRTYRAGELERRYPRLAVEEDFFVNYGFLPETLAALMHPRRARQAWTRRWAQAQAVLEFVRERGSVHPAEVDAHFAHGRVRNWFGGSGRASTELLDGMHYRGLLRIARRDAGVRVYAARAPMPPPADRAEARARHDALVDTAIALYAPLPAATLGQLLSHLCRGGVPQWQDERAAALARARARHPSARITQASTGCGRRARTRRPGGTPSTTACACWHPSTRSSGTGAALRCSGAGTTASRPTRRRPGASSATTRCRCCGAGR